MVKQKHPLHPFENKFFRVGDIVRIRGSHLDATDHLDGLTGVVTSVCEKDCLVDFGVEYDGEWWVWKWNMTHA